MKLASLNSGRDGCLVVVSKDLTRAVKATPIAATMQAALDDWHTASTELIKLYDKLNAGAVAHSFEFDATQCDAALPRAYHWADGSAYVTHVELVRKARGAELPESFWSDPLVYMGASDAFLGPTDDVPVEREAWGIDFEAEVIVITDDQGYGDLGYTGNPIIKTPNIDKLASESSGLSDYHVGPTCSPTRCSLLTGRWTNRTGVWHTIMGRSMLRENEVTVAQMLSNGGYATGMFGKWHLGDQPEFLPTRQGFDYYYGIPYSNDMNRDFCPLPLMRGEKVIEAPVDQNTITQRYTEEVIAFINKNKDNPFFPS